MRTLALAPLFAAVLLLPQDPQPPKAPTRPAPPPAGAPALPPVEEPQVRPALRDDLLQRFDARDPLEGVYQLRRKVQNGVETAAPGGGFLVIGRRHLLIHLQGPGPSPDFPLLQASVRHWRREGDALRMSVVSGHFNDAGGDIKVEAPGTIESRRFELVGGILRIHQGRGSWLEFARAE